MSRLPGRLLPRNILKAEPTTHYPAASSPRLSTALKYPLNGEIVLED